MIRRVKTLNFQIGGDAGIDLIRLFVDDTHAAIATTGATQGFPRLALAGILRKMADACEDGGEAVMREIAQARLTASGPVLMEQCRGTDHKKLVGSPCPICSPPRSPLRGT